MADSPHQAHSNALAWEAGAADMQQRTSRRRASSRRWLKTMIAAKKVICTLH
jgi:hypothetical protein